MRHRRPPLPVLLLAACLTGTGAKAAADADAGSLISRALTDAEAGRALEALDHAEQAYYAVWDLLPLGFRRIEEIAGDPEGFGRVTPREGAAYGEGEAINLYVEPIGFGWRKAADGWTTDLTTDFTLATPEGRIIAGQKGFGEFVIQSPFRARETYLVVNYEFSGIPPGDYILTTTLHDAVDDETAAFDTAITIR